VVSLRFRSFNRRLITSVLVFASAVMASDAPPSVLPRGFLEQLPILMQLSEKEFEYLLKYAEDTNLENSRNENKATKMGNSNKGEHDEN